MSIDEAITKYKDIANVDATCPEYCNISCHECIQESRQIAELLEELKNYRDKTKMVVRIDCVNSEEFKDIAVKLAKEQYNKAIYDLSNALKENYDYLPQIFSQEAFDRYIDEYAEQLKAGD